MNRINKAGRPRARVSLAERRVARRPALKAKLEHMSRKLYALVQVNTGHKHACFPGTILHFWLLTNDQLESLAHFFHQRTPSVWTRRYPCPMSTWSPSLPLEVKRRKFGKFIGLRGCDTPPVVQSPAKRAPAAAGARVDHVDHEAASAAHHCYGESRSPYSGNVQDLTTAVLKPWTCTLPVRLSKPSPPSSEEPSLHDQLSNSSVDGREPRARTVEEVIENARRARLAGDASEEAMRRKLRYYR